MFSLRLLVLLQLGLAQGLIDRDGHSPRKLSRSTLVQQKNSIDFMTTIYTTVTAVMVTAGGDIDGVTGPVAHVGNTCPKVPFHYGNPKCPCIGIDDTFGTTVVAIDKSTKHPYPADIGAHCKAWDNNRSPKYCKTEDQDPGLDKGWCANAWCYVDPCNCNLPVEPKTSGYLPGATYHGKTLYYSYATCGAKDSWFAEHHVEGCINQKTSKDCEALMKPDGSPKCSWDGGRCGGKELMGQCSQDLDASTSGQASCMCIGIHNRPGSVMMNVDGKGKIVPYPADTGSSCKAWDQHTSPSCTGPSPPEWCSQAWCYVDPCNCALKPSTSAYLPDARFQGKRVYYSYETCSGTDHYTEDFHYAACSNQETEDACVKLDNGQRCGWTGTECLGKEIAGECTAHPPKSDPHHTHE